MSNSFDSQICQYVRPTSIKMGTPVVGAIYRLRMSGETTALGKLYNVYDPDTLLFIAADVPGTCFEPAPLRHFIADCPHGGGLPFEEFETDAYTFGEAYNRFWQECIGSRYVSRVFERKNNAWVEVWRSGQAFPVE